MSIENLRESNIGGAYKLKIISSDKIESFPDARGNVISFGDIVLTAGSDWEQWNFRPEVLSFEENPSGEFGSDAFDAFVEGAVPKDRSEIISKFSQMPGKRYVVLIFFNNNTTGAQHIIALGSKSEPAKFLIGRRSAGKQVIDFNGNEFVFSTVGRNTKCNFVEI